MYPLLFATPEPAHQWNRATLLTDLFPPTNAYRGSNYCAARDNILVASRVYLPLVAILRLSSANKALKGLE